MVALYNCSARVRFAAFDETVGVRVDLEAEVPVVFLVDDSNLESFLFKFLKKKSSGNPASVSSNKVELKRTI